MINEWLKHNKLTICPPKTRSDPSDIISKKYWKKKKKNDDA